MNRQASIRSLITNPSFNARSLHGGDAASADGTVLSSSNNSKSSKSNVRPSNKSNGDSTALTSHDDEDDGDEFQEDDLNQLKYSSFVGRDDELEKLQSIYAGMVQQNRNNSSSISISDDSKLSQLILVDGYSGTGKSALVQEFIGSINDKTETTSNHHPCNLCQGKYDQYNGSGTLSAVAEAFSDYFVNLASSSSDDNDVERRTAVVQGIQKGLDSTRRDLSESLIPGLRILMNTAAAANLSAEDIDDGSRSSETLDLNRQEAPSKDAGFEALNVSESRDSVWTQLVYSFKLIIRTIISASDLPLLLYLDDLQWADQRSLDLITELFLDASICDLLVIGSFRSNEVHDNQDHILNVAMPKWEHILGNRNIPVISLTNLTQGQIQVFLASTLRLEVDEAVQSLANILHRKTEGNIFFVIQALESIRRKGILRKDIHTLKWTWDSKRAEEEISLASNVVDLITSKLHSLPNSVQRYLMVASFLKSAFNQATLEALMTQEYLEQNIPCDVDSMLNTSVKEGLLERDHSKASDESPADETQAKPKIILRFAHGRIQQAVISLLPTGDELEEMRHRIGKHLIKLARDAVLGEKWMLFVAADLFETASDLPESDHIMPTLELVRLNLEVGEMAMNVSAFIPAAKFFNRALRILTATVYDPWNLERGLCSQVHRLLSEVEFYLGNYEVGAQLCNTMLQHSDGIPEKIKVYSALGTALCRDGRFDEALNMFMGSLQLLKVFPQRCHIFYMLQDARRVKNSLKSRTDEEILDLPLMTNQKMKYAMFLLRFVIHSAYHVGNMPLTILAVFRQLRMTLKYGLTPEGGSAFASYATVLMNITLEKDPAQRAANLSVKVLDKTESKQVDANAMLVIAGFVAAWREPIHKTLSMFQRGHRSGMQSGDLENAYWNWGNSLSCGFLAGISLDQIHRSGTNFVAQMEHYRIVTVCECQYFVRYMLEYLMGVRTRDASTEMWKEYRGMPPLKSINPRDGVKWGFRCWGLIQLSTYFGELDVAKKTIALFKRLTKDELAFVTLTVRSFHSGLTYSRLARRTGKRKYIRLSQKDRDEMKKTVTLKESTNNLHRYLLMEADLLAATNKKDTDAVKAAYDKAISHAARSGVLHDCALGNELAGEYFLSKVSDATSSNQSRSNLGGGPYEDLYWPKQYLSSAIKLYDEWGAKGKVAHMQTKYGHLLESELELESAFQSSSMLGSMRTKRHSTHTRTCLENAHEMFSQVNFDDI